MVLVDGHDPAWVSRFRSAVEDGTIVKLSFLHMNLNLVPWKEMIWAQSSSPFVHRHSRSSRRKPKKWQTIEFIDCRRLEAGLTQLFAMNIERIHISANQSHVLSKQFGQILGLGLMESKSLKQLNLSSCTWSIEATKQLQQGLRTTCTLEKLDLSFTLWNTSNGDGSESNNHMTNISGGDVCIQYLAQGLAQNKTIRCLKLNRCNLFDHQIAHLIKYGLLPMMTMTTKATQDNGGSGCSGCFEELYLSGNTLKEQSMEGLSSLLSSPNCHLKLLDLSNPFNHHDDDNTTDDPYHYFQPTLFRSLAIAPTHQHSLQVLNLASNKLTDNHVDSLILAVKGQSNIIAVDLKSNLITDIGIIKLAEDLPSQLQRLFLQGNPFAIDGASSLLKTIKEKHSQMIDLRIPTYNTLQAEPALQRIQQHIRYYEALNRAGRQVLMNDDTNKHVPMGLWPLILERINHRINFEDNGYGSYTSSNHNKFKAEICYAFLRFGPALLNR